MEKQFKKLPQAIQKKIYLLVKDLKEKGAVQTNWMNYSKLEKDKYHYHLAYSWVACWEYRDNSIVIEIYYVGSRENAPY